jgi:hypothetical protein
MLVLDTRKKGLLHRLKFLWSVLVGDDVVLSNGKATLYVKNGRLTVVAETIIFRYKLLAINCDEGYIQERLEEFNTVEGATRKELPYKSTAIGANAEEEEWTACER